MEKLVKSIPIFLLYSAVLSAQEPRFFQWSNDVAKSLLAERAAAIAKIHDVPAAESRKNEVHAKVLQLIGDLPQYNGPLNSQLTGAVDQGNYWIEKILFESMPGLIVSANVYAPKSPGPHPAVLFQIGHFPDAKAYDQVIPGNLALKGFVVLAFDPLGQGERLQGYDPNTGMSLAAEGVEQHLMAGGQSLLVGQNFARYEIFDARRAIDYLMTRPDVDANRIGATGCSGGGTLTTYVAMLDTRIKAAAPACFTNSFEYLYPDNLIGDSEQSFPEFLSSGLDQVDFIELFSPKPWLILSTVQDFFPLQGAQAAYDEASKWYGLYGAAAKVQWVVGPGEHGTPLEVRQAIYGWMIQWLKNSVGDATEQSIVSLPPSQLLASSTGQVGGEQIYQVIRTTTRKPGSAQQLAAALKQWISVPSGAPSITVTGQTDNGTYVTRSISFDTQPG